MIIIFKFTLLVYSRSDQKTADVSFLLSDDFIACARFAVRMSKTMNKFKNGFFTCMYFYVCLAALTNYGL